MTYQKESGYPTQEVESNKELTRRFEYTDAAGNMLGSGTMELDSEKKQVFTRECLTLNGELPIVQRLKRFQINGTSGSLEALPFLGIAVPVLIPTEPVWNFNYAPNLMIISPELRSPLDIGVALHEAGHERQEKEAEFVRLKDLKNTAEDIRSQVEYVDQSEAIARLLQDMREMVLARKNTYGFTNEKIDALILLLQEDSEAKRLLHAWYRNKSINYPETNKKSRQIEAQLKPYQDAINQVLALPRRLLEYDATRRAMMWAVQIKDQTGVDLFAPCLVDQSASKDSAVHQDSTRSAHGLSPAKPGRISTILDTANEALQTFGADQITL